MREYWINVYQCDGDTWYGVSYYEPKSKYLVYRIHVRMK